MRDLDAIAEVQLVQRGHDGGAWTLGPLRIIASDGGHWDHVSVSLPDRCPTWEEMERVKRLFFRENETALQYHVPPKDHINQHTNCLHLWRPQVAPIPRPPQDFV